MNSNQRVFASLYKFLTGWSFIGGLFMCSCAGAWAFLEHSVSAAYLVAFGFSICLFLAINKAFRKWQIGLRYSLILAGSALFFWLAYKMAMAKKSLETKTFREWLPPKLPADCKMVSIQLGGISRVSYEMSFINAAPMGRVGFTNLLVGEIESIFDTRFPLEKRYTNVFYGVPEWDLTNNPHSLKNPIVETNPIPIGYSLYLKDNRAYVDFLSVSDGRKVMIFGERPDAIPPTWDHNFDSTTSEIVDEYARVVFRIIYVNPYTIRVEAFYSQNGTWAVFGENRFGLGNLDSNAITGNSNVLILTPIFKYPSWLYPAMRN